MRLPSVCLWLTLPFALACGGGGADETGAKVPGMTFIASQVEGSSGIWTFGVHDLARDLTRPSRVALIVGTSVTSFTTNSGVRIVSDASGANSVYESVGAGGSAYTASFGRSVLLSDDGGATWSRHDLAGLRGFPAGLALEDGRVYIADGTWSENALGGAYTFRIREFSPATNTLGPDIGSPFHAFRRLAHRKGEVTAYELRLFTPPPDPAQYPNNVAGANVWQRVTLATGVTRSLEQTVKAAAVKDLYRPFVPFASVDGGNFFATFTWPRPETRCFATVRPEPWENDRTQMLRPAETRCHSALHQGLAGMVTEAKAGLITVASRDQSGAPHAWATRASNGPLEEVYLGPGFPEDHFLRAGLLHHRLDRLVALRVPETPTTDRTRYVEVPSSGPANELVFDGLDACVGVKNCKSRLGLLLRLDSADTWLAVVEQRTTNSFGNQGQQRVFAKRVVARRVEVPAPSAAPDKFSGCWPEPKSNELDAWCVRFASRCGASVPHFTLTSCTSALVSASPGERARVLATTPSCDAWRPASTASPETTPGCSPGRLSCEGAIVSRCLPGGATSERFDCGALGVGCEVDAAGAPRCVPTLCPYADLAATRGGRCDGDYLLYPIGKTERAVSCSALGLGPCVLGPRYPYCSPPPPPLTGGSAPSAIERACVFAEACAPDTAWRDACLKRQLERGAENTAFTSATTCASLSVADPAEVPPQQSCDPDTNTDGYCLGSVLVNCDSAGHVQVIADCAALGGQCRSGAGGRARCEAAAGVCSAPGRSCTSSGAACSDDPSEPIGYDDCARRGLACLSDGFGGSQCLVSAAACGAEAEARCEGERLLRCTGTAGRARAGENCALVPGLACRAEFDQCHATAGDCPASPPAPTSQCSGRVLRYCSLGQLRVFDCAALGATCVNAGGVSKCRLP